MSQNQRYAQSADTYSSDTLHQEVLNAQDTQPNPQKSAQSLNQIHPILQQNLSGNGQTVESAPLVDGQHILNGRYLVKKLLAKGGMGEVYVGEHCLTNRKVAIKRMLPELTIHKEAVDRFLREGRAAVKVSHSNVVQVLDADSDEFGLYLIMEYLDGKDFDAWLLEHPKEKSKALALLYQILQPLAEAHERGLIHRDLKPENLYIEGHGGVKIIDFGIARDFKSANPTQVVGTPQYMSPEQYHNPNGCDPTTDVWALGVILYRIVAQSLPFDGDDIIAIYRKVALQPISLSPAIPEPLRLVIEQCMKKDPAQRPKNAREVLNLWHQYQINELIEQGAFDPQTQFHYSMAQTIDDPQNHKHSSAKPASVPQQLSQPNPMPVSQSQANQIQKSVHTFNRQDLQHIHQLSSPSQASSPHIPVPTNPKTLENMETTVIVEDQLAKVNQNIRNHLNQIEELKKESSSKTYILVLMVIVMLVMALLFKKYINY